MSRDCLLGLDVGTSNIKAVAFDAAAGQVVALAAAPTPVSHPRPEWTEFDPAGLWQSTCRCLQQALAALPADYRVAAIAVASMGEAGVPLDGTGRPLYPMIAWHDPRSEPQAEELRRRIGAETIHRITGQKARHIFSATKLLWLREHHPDVIRRMALWLCVEDYIIWQLSGAATTDYTVASRTMLFDQERAAWSPQLLDVCGITAQVLPQPLPSGTTVGTVTASAARLTGLSEGTAVATGGHDHLCGALAVGAVERGRFLDSAGTAEAMLAPVERFYGGGAVFASGLSCYRHVLPGRFMLQGGLNTAGGALEWLTTVTGGGPDGYAGLFAAAERSGPGARGVFCLPHFGGCASPVVDAESRGAFVGLTLAHGRGDMMRALVEGLAYHLRENMDHIAGIAPLAEGHILAIGGGNREPLMLQTKADVCNRPVHYATVPEAVAVGAALLAGLAIGMFGSAAEAAAAVRCDFQRYQPDPERARLYDAWYRETFLGLYPMLLRWRAGASETTDAHG